MSVKDITDEFFAVREVRADREWAEGAVFRLLMNDIALPDAERALTEPLAALREARACEASDTALELFGEPATWAREATRELLEQGVETTAGRPLPAADHVFIAAGFAAVGSAIWAVSTLISEGWQADFSVARLLLTPAIMVFMTALMTVHRTSTARFGFRLGITATVVAFSAGAALIAALAALPWHTWRASTLWYFVVPAACAGIAYAAARQPQSSARVRRSRMARATAGETAPLAPSGHTARPEDWYTELAAQLRTSGKFSDTEVQRHVREARSHALDMGADLLDEFGSPAAYAARLPAQRGVKEFRTALLNTLVGVAVAIGALTALIDGESWTRWFYQGVLIAWAFICIRSWRTYLGTRRPSAQGGGA